MIAYEQFPLVEETNTDGWIYGAITKFIEPNGCDGGDGFVQTTYGSRAGLDWKVGRGELRIISGPYNGECGIFEVYFPKMVFTVQDLVDNFRYVLPAVKHQYELYKETLT